MTSQTRKQTIPIPILPNMSKSNGNQTMTFGQITEYNMRNIFLQKSDTKLAPDSFLKKKLGIFLDEQSNILCNLSYYIF